MSNFGWTNQPLKFGHNFGHNLPLNFGHNILIFTLAGYIAHTFGCTIEFCGRV